MKIRLDEYALADVMMIIMLVSMPLLMLWLVLAGGK